MERKARLFIYDRREIAVLILLGVMVALFAFTLGVHLGKRVHPHALGVVPRDTRSAETVPDQIPNRQELTEQGKAAPQAGDEALTQALHDEVSKTGVKLDTPRQVELPDEPISENAGATTLKRAATSAPKATPRSAGHYTLQVGSYQTQGEAETQLKALAAHDLKAALKPVEIQGKGTWFRVYVGTFGSRDEAQTAGARYKSRKVIGSFVVANQAAD